MAYFHCVTNSFFTIFFSDARPKRLNWQVSAYSDEQEYETKKDEFDAAEKASKHAMEKPPKNKK